MPTPTQAPTQGRYVHRADLYQLKPSPVPTPALARALAQSLAIVSIDPSRRIYCKPSIATRLLQSIK